MNIQEFKSEFDTLFIQEITRLATHANSIVDGHITITYFDHLIELASHGKRIRPYNVALAYSTYNNTTWYEIKDVLIGVELLHLMCLVHDDIMDVSDTRHGVFSMHRFIQTKIPQISDKTLATQVSNSEAVLIGDLIFGWAYMSFTKATLSQASWNIVHELVNEVVLGQMLDVHTPIETSLSDTLIERKMLLKTARYTFTRPLLLGALCAGKKEEEVDWLQQYGDQAGLLFQMQDDVLDIMGDVTGIKKEPLGDIKNKVHTLISNHVTKHATEAELTQWQLWFGNHELNNQKEIIDFIEQVGGFTFANNYIRNKLEQARTAVVHSGLSEEKQQQFISLLEKISNRTS